MGTPGPASTDQQGRNLPGHRARPFGDVGPAVSQRDVPAQEGRIVALHVAETTSDVHPAVQLDDGGPLLVEQIADLLTAAAAGLTLGPGESVRTFDLGEIAQLQRRLRPLSDVPQHLAEQIAMADTSSIFDPSQNPLGRGASSLDGFGQQAR